MENIVNILIRIGERDIKMNEKICISAFVVIQTIVIIIINFLVIHAIRATQQNNLKWITTTKIISIFDIIASTFDRISFLLLLNIRFENEKISTTLLSTLVIWKQLDLGIICFVAFDRLIKVIYLNNKNTTNAKSRTYYLVIFILWSVFSLSSVHITIYYKSITLITIISNILLAALILTALFSHILTYILLWIFKNKSTTTTTTSIDRHVLRLSEMYILCFIIFKSSYALSLLVSNITSSNETIIFWLFVIVNIIPSLNAIFNSVIFIYINKPTQRYLIKKLKRQN